MLNAEAVADHILAREEYRDEITLARFIERVQADAQVDLRARLAAADRDMALAKLAAEQSKRREEYAESSAIMLRFTDRIVATEARAEAAEKERDFYMGECMQTWDLVIEGQDDLAFPLVDMVKAKLAAAQAEVGRMREALTWYASPGEPNEYIVCQRSADGGLAAISPLTYFCDRARAALSPGSGGEGKGKGTG